jgi:class 3 adenylate cyclase/HAMP domain-containing protein
MILIVLPLVVTPLLFAGLVAGLLARNGITGVATQFLQFKAEQIATYAGGQWQLLVDNDLENRRNYREAAVDAVASFAAGVVRTDTELIFAVDREGRLAFMVGSDPALRARYSEAEISGLGMSPISGWHRFRLAGLPRVSFSVPFEPFQWMIYVTEREQAFYASVSEILTQVAVVLAVAIVASFVLLVVFSGYLVRPLRTVVGAMTAIIETNDLSRRVEVRYGDETGRLAHTFNVMTGQLERSYEHIKAYALQAATSEIKERKTRTMFQKYVPNDVIEQFFRSPEDMLVGAARPLSILFSDIREFTTISEALAPDVLVETLNRYFTVMVETIMRRNGIVDKYIGDAIMALFGAPAARTDDARSSVYAALEMVDALGAFNREQEAAGRPPFRVGIGINYGVVTVGNIGSEQKLDYTVIGDAVNVSSRLEGLTKRYRVPIIVSETVLERIDDEIASGRLFCRLLDTVKVKGRTSELRVYAVARELAASELEAWTIHDEGMELFYRREFAQAEHAFEDVGRLLPDDQASRLMLERIRTLARDEPDDAWSGVLEMTEK